MASPIKLIGVDVPNTTIQNIPQGSPLMVEDDADTGQQLVSANMSRTAQMFLQSNQNASQTLDKTNQATQQALGSALEYDQRAIASRPKDPLNMSGFAQLGDTVSRFLEADERKRQAEIQAQQKLLEEQRQAEFYRVSSQVEEFTASLQTSLRENPGGYSEIERQFKKIVDDNPNLNPEFKSKLYSQFYGAAAPIRAEFGRNLVDNTEKYRAQYREYQTNQLKFEAVGIVTAIKSANDEDTINTNLDTLKTRMGEVMKDTRFSDLDRLTMVNDIENIVLSARYENADSQVKTLTLTRNFTEFIRGANSLKRMMASGEMSRVDYQVQVGFLAQKTGVPESISKVYGVNYEMEDANEQMKLLEERRELIEKGEERAQDAVPFTNLMIGRLVAMGKGDINSEVIAKLIPGTANYNRVKGVIDQYNEYTKLRSEVTQQNLILQGNALQNSESFAKAVIARLRGNTSVNLEQLQSWGFNINPATVQLLQQNKVNPAEEQRYMDELRNVYNAQNEVIHARQKANVERLNQLTGVMRGYGLSDGFGNFPTKQWEAEVKIHQEKMNRYRQSQQQYTQGAKPNFKAPRLATVPHQAGSSFAPFREGAKFSIPQGGEHRNNRGTHFHAGQDYSAAEGTEIIAHIPMRVVSIKNQGNAGYGHYITTQGADGKFYRYAHLSRRPTLREGQQVPPGSVLGLVGNTGRSSGPHLHFEVRTNDGYGDNGSLDPIQFMRQFTPSNISKQMRGRNTDGFETDGNPTTERASIPANAMSLGGGLFMLNGNVYTKETLERRNQTKYRPSAPIRQQNNASTKSSYRPSKTGDENFGYAPLQRDAPLRKEIHRVARSMGFPPQWLADVMAFETGGTFSKDIDNNHGYRGLIQMSEDSAREVGTSTTAFGSMSAAQQMKYVEKYLRQRTNNGKWISSPFDILAAVWAGNSSPEQMKKLWSSPDGMTDCGVTGGTPGNGCVSWRMYVERLGSHAGRRYDSPLTRRSRLQSRLRNDTPELMASNSVSVFQEVYS